MHKMKVFEFSNKPKSIYSTGQLPAGSQGRLGRVIIVFCYSQVCPRPREHVALGFLLCQSTLPERMNERGSQKAPGVSILCRSQGKHGRIRARSL